ncbi:hypothetical protein K443DRAFT_8824 [Laccaria amethystina LaAM-08-1]|uniref:Uncharacterized protein n=1 Tax=Laccaria amethystina LaAM-08-1 TaxID=1095629 RepID=A0A0C9XBK2_9AGAR|nr:hypothetical protein K443DRAFT_8824 [Laccaria amethystina LaAM-08-1]
MDVVVEKEQNWCTNNVTLPKSGQQHIGFEQFHVRHTGTWWAGDPIRVMVKG